MKQKYETYINFTCPTCKQPVGMRMDAPEPDWSADSGSGWEVEDQDDVVCPTCGDVFRINIQNNLGSCAVTLEEHPETKVIATFASYAAPEDEEWADYDIPDDPYAIFMDSHHTSAHILFEHGGGVGADLVNRMVFAHQFTALEAYLSDTLIKAAMADNDAIAQLLSTDTELAGKKFTLAQIMSEPDFVKSKVLSHLRSIVYHHLPRVRVLYQTVFEIDVFKFLDEASKERLMKAVEYRHDCVHRNGHDKEGVKLEIFHKAYVTMTADMMRAWVNDIQAAIRKKRDDEPVFE